MAGVTHHTSLALAYYLAATLFTETVADVTPVALNALTEKLYVGNFAPARDRPVIVVPVAVGLFTVTVVGVALSDDVYVTV
jgi:hypothetical protein